MICSPVGSWAQAVGTHRDRSRVRARNRDSRRFFINSFTSLEYGKIRRRGGHPPRRRSLGLFHHVQVILIVAEDEVAVVTGHAAQGVGVVGGLPGVIFRVCGQVPAAGGVAEAAAGAGVGVEVHIAVAVQDGALDREAGGDGGHAAVGGGAPLSEGGHLDAAGVEAGVVPGVDIDGGGSAAGRLHQGSALYTCMGNKFICSYMIK